MCMSVQESSMECWSVVACFRVWGTEYSSACMGHFEAGHHYHHYIHHSLASGQSPAHQQKIGIKIYWVCPKEAGQVVWYSHLFNNFPQFVVIHTVKGFGKLNIAEVDVFLELSCFFDNPVVVGNWSLVPLLFPKPAGTSGSSWFTYCWSLAWRIFSITLLVCEMSAIVW